MKSGKRKVLFHLNADFKGNRGFAQFAENDMSTTYDTTMIVGNGTYNGVYFPEEELQKAAESFLSVPINLDHSDDTVKDVVGYVSDVVYENGRLKSHTVFDKDTKEYDTAIGYIKSRQRAGDVPNVSIGVWLELEEEKLSNDDTRLVARNLEGDHLALVVHGACNPDDGCGIGMTDLSQLGKYTYEPKGEITFIGDAYQIVNPEDEITIDLNKEEKEDLKKNIYKELIKKERLEHD